MLLHLRHKKTILYLGLATLISLITYREDYMTSSSFWPLATPLLFGIGLVISNWQYSKNDLVSVCIPVVFFFVYFIGSVMFGMIGSSLTNSSFGFNLLGCASALAMVLITTKLAFRGVTIGPMQFMLILFLSLICSFLLPLLKGESLIDVKLNGIPRLDLTILFYQSSMILVLISAIEDNEYLIND